MTDSPEGTPLNKCDSSAFRDHDPSDPSNPKLGNPNRKNKNLQPWKPNQAKKPRR